MLLEMPKAPSRSEGELWPAEVDLILSAMDAAPHPAGEERRSQRMAYRVRADLHLYADGEGADPWTLYTRDVDPRGLGFITRHRLPLGYGGWIELLAPSGRKQRISSTLYRCREVVPGWFEGALYFNREQFDFVAED